MPLHRRTIDYDRACSKKSYESFLLSRRGLAISKYVQIFIMADQRALYEWADIVIMPMRENFYSGITVMCEAAAMGKPIVATKTGGEPTYLDEDEVIYVPIGDALAMKNAVLNASSDRLLAIAEAAQARFVRDDYSAKGMVERYVAISETLRRACRSERTSERKDD